MTMSKRMLCNSTLARLVAVSLAMASGAFLTVVLPSVPATAQTAAQKSAVDAAKAAGTVGEQGDGYLGFVTPSTDPALAASVAAINAGRREVYHETAMKTNVSVDAAGQATAQQLFARLPAGQFFRPLNGNWTRKS
jgi:uncharacterized protein YdbL (DUF1318 family)